MDRSLPDDWLYDRVMLQLLGTAGTVEANESRNFHCKEYMPSTV